MYFSMEKLNKKYSATLLVRSVTVRVLHILLSQDNLDLLILHMSGVCKTQAFTLLLKCWLLHPFNWGQTLTIIEWGLILPQWESNGIDHSVIWAH